MGKHKNTALVQSIYGAFLRGDVPAILSKLSEAVDWSVGPSPNGVPWFGTRKGRAEVGEFFETLGKEVDVTKFEPTEYVSQYDRVVALVHEELMIRRTGRSVSQDVVMVWTIQDSKVVALVVYEDTKAIAAAWSGQ
jgi:ketosteroid isomerase-like protein